MYKRQENKQAISGWSDVFTNATHISALVTLIKKCVGSRVKGIYNYGISEVYSKYQFLNDICARIDPDISVNSIFMPSGKIEKNRNCGVSLNKIHSQLWDDKLTYEGLIDLTCNDIMKQLKEI